MKLYQSNDKKFTIIISIFSLIFVLFFASKLLTTDDRPFPIDRIQPNKITYFNNYQFKMIDEPIYDIDQNMVEVKADWFVEEFDFTEKNTSDEERIDEFVRFYEKQERQLEDEEIENLKIDKSNINYQTQLQTYKRAENMEGKTIEITIQIDLQDTDLPEMLGIVWETQTWSKEWNAEIEKSEWIKKSYNQIGLDYRQMKIDELQTFDQSYIDEESKNLIDKLKYDANNSISSATTTPDDEGDEYEINVIEHDDVTPEQELALLENALEIAKSDKKDREDELEALKKADASERMLQAKVDEIKGLNKNISEYESQIKKIKEEAK